MSLSGYVAHQKPGQVLCMATTHTVRCPDFASMFHKDKQEHVQFQIFDHAHMTCNPIKVTDEFGRPFASWAVHMAPIHDHQRRFQCLVQSRTATQSDLHTGPYLLFRLRSEDVFCMTLYDTGT